MKSKVALERGDEGASIHTVRLPNEFLDYLLDDWKELMAYKFVPQRPWDVPEKRPRRLVIYGGVNGSNREVADYFKVHGQKAYLCNHSNLNMREGVFYIHVGEMYLLFQKSLELRTRASQNRSQFGLRQ